jgi:murein DD-endopeptidase MepM/ murein hydrolase activator NlpD
MKTEPYVVRQGDTLWKISKKTGYSVDTLASINKLKGRAVHLIRVDQVLQIPVKEGAKSDSKLKVQLRGLDFKPMTPPKVKAEHDGEVVEPEVDKEGSIWLTIKDHTRGLKLWVEGLDKSLEQVFNADRVPLGSWLLSVDSRMVKADGALQSKKGPPAAKTEEVKEAVTHNAQLGQGKTAEQQTRAEAGKPTHGLATIYTSENLRLAPSNEKYRKLIVDAAAKYGLTPQALAALIDAEAAKVRKTGEWLEKSNQSSPDLAQGLAQFFEAAWSAVYKDERSLLHADTQSLSPSARLAKRLEAKYAIDGAATYAVINIEAFETNTGLAVKSLSPEDKAKFAYFLHHEGEYGARRVLGLTEESLTERQWKHRLSKQLGDDEEAVEKVMEQYDDNAQEAYKGWLFSYTDTKINVNHFVVKDAENFTKPPRAMVDIVSSLGKAQPAAKPAAKKPAAPAAPKKPATPPAAAKKTPPPAAKAPAPAAPPAAPQAQAPAAAASGGDTPTWHNPLSTCTLRTAGLGPTGARFGWTRKNGTKNHQGIDLVAVPGTPIHAVADGKVYVKPAKSPTYAYGNTLILEVSVDDLPPKQAALVNKINPGAKTIGFFYAHLSELPENQKHVFSGEVIGKTGESGNAAGMNTVAKGAHLHFEVRIKPFVVTTGLANRTDPLPFIENCTNA